MQVSARPDTDAFAKQMAALCTRHQPVPRHRKRRVRAGRA
jgi:hypothetical protein